MVPFLDIQLLSVRFGGLSVLEHLSMRFLDPKGIYAVIGPNGAGKSTLFNALTALIPYEGRILLNGKALEGLNDVARARLGIQRTFQNILLFQRLTVAQNLLVALHDQMSIKGLLSLPAQQKDFKQQMYDQVRERLDFVGLSQSLDLFPHQLAYGHRRLVELARALVRRPKLLLLDEPAAGLNPTEKLMLIDVLKKIQSQGIAIIMIEHDMPFIHTVAEEVFVLHDRSLIFQGNMEEVQKANVVQEAYLGVKEREKTSGN